MKNFENWETQDVETAFGIQRAWESKLLDSWLSSTLIFKDHEMKSIEKLREKIFRFADYWNEDELKLQCISRLIDLANYDLEQFGCNMFSQRSLSATINGTEIGGKVDFLLSKGKQKPIEPYFFIHEYKQETKKGSSDPKGQLLSEMLVAQARNQKKFPIYGAYVVGRNWFFMILDQDYYAVSNAYNASDEDIYKIIAVLKKVNDYIIAIVTSEGKEPTSAVVAWSNPPYHDRIRRDGQGIDGKREVGGFFE